MRTILEQPARVPVGYVLAEVAHLPFDVDFPVRSNDRPHSHALVHDVRGLPGQCVEADVSHLVLDMDPVVRVEHAADHRASPSSIAGLKGLSARFPLFYNLNRRERASRKGPSANARPREAP